MHIICNFFNSNSLKNTYLKGPQEIAGVFELRANSKYLMNQILGTDDIRST